MRSTLRAFCHSWWEARGVVPVDAPSPDGPFNRSAAINAALGACDSWDVAVVLDADVLGCAVELKVAIDLASRSERVVFPFTHYVGLAPWGTREVLAGGRLEEAGALRVVDNHESSVVVIPRSTWVATGGFDERFVGWGGDDVSFCHSARILTGEPKRVDGIVYHLWHEVAREKYPGEPLWEANQALARRYRAASTPVAIKELLWERNAERSSKISTREGYGTAKTA